MPVCGLCAAGGEWQERSRAAESFPKLSHSVSELRGSVSPLRILSGSMAAFTASIPLGCALAAEARSRPHVGETERQRQLLGGKCVTLSSRGCYSPAEYAHLFLLSSGRKHVNLGHGKLVRATVTVDPLPELAEEISGEVQNGFGGLNKYSSRITQPKSQGASQAMLYGVGLSEEDMSKPQVRLVLAAHFSANKSRLRRAAELRSSAVLSPLPFSPFFSSLFATLCLASSLNFLFFCAVGQSAVKGLGSEFNLYDNDTETFHFADMHVLAGVADWHILGMVRGQHVQYASAHPCRGCEGRSREGRHGGLQVQHHRS